MQNDSQKWFKAFERGNRFQKHSLLTQLVQHTNFSTNPKVRSFLQKLTFCGIGWKDIRLPNGHVLHRRNFCNQPQCPKCRSFIVKRDADRGWQRFFDTIGPGFNASDFSFVSVNGSVIDPSNPRHTRDTSDRKIKRHLKEIGSPLLCYGRYELTRTDDRQLRLDWHFICYHPGITREHLVAYLRKKFPERRAINVKPLRGGGSGLKKNLKKVLRYSGKMHISGNKVKNGSIDDVIELISTYEQIRSTGLKGLRFEFGFRSWVRNKLYGEYLNSFRNNKKRIVTYNNIISLKHFSFIFIQCVLNNKWSLNYNPYKKLIRAGSIPLRPPDLINRIYPNPSFHRLGLPRFYPQARAPPVRGDPFNQGDHPVLGRCAENPCGLPRQRARVSAGLTKPVWACRNYFFSAR
ncbi:MAG: hypothetical protein ABJO97_18820 [Roseibium sp.]|uniref:hypothetical protein n=1 Tax=Alphaproteobacteria TaxID=28211 RepID=UPI00329691D6